MVWILIDACSFCQILEIETDANPRRSVRYAMCVDGCEDFRPHVNSSIEVGLEAESDRGANFRGSRRRKIGHYRRIESRIGVSLPILRQNVDAYSGGYIRMRENVLQELISDSPRNGVGPNVTFDVVIAVRRSRRCGNGFPIPPLVCLYPTSFEFPVRRQIPAGLQIPGDT